MRIKQILDLYGIDSQDFSNLKAPNIDVVLNAELLKSYGVDEAEWKKYVKKYHLENNTQETVATDGMIVQCKHSHLVNLLEQTAHPSGISRRLVRFFDGKPLPECRVD